MPREDSRVAQANAAVEEEMDYSDEVDEDEEDYLDGEMDTSSRLRQPVSHHRSLLELYELVKDERYMNINPDYQREVVWSEQRMIHLIDSLFNNYYVPPLIFKAITGVKEGTNERRKWRTCIDGKQRLTTIRRFFDGEIPYIDRHRQKWYYSTPVTNSKTAKVLSDEDREFFNNIQIVNIEFEHLTDEQEEDMFQRVQLGVPLTVAEKLAALTGLIPSFINDVRKSYKSIPSLMGTKRAKDYQLIATLIFLMHCHMEEDEDLKLKASQALLRKFVEDPNPERILTPSFRAKVRKVFTKYNELLVSYADAFTHTLGSTKAKSRRFSPVEFLGVGIMLDRYPDRPINALAEDVKAFREYLREHLHDLRTNSMTWVHVMDFINRLEDSRGYYPPEQQSNKRFRTAKGAPATSPSRKSTFNPPTPDKQIQVQHTTVYNNLQQQAMEARLAQQMKEQREAFRTIPSSRSQPEDRAGTSAGRRPDHAGGVQERGSSKRTHDGVPVKREREH